MRSATAATPTGYGSPGRTTAGPSSAGSIAPSSASEVFGGPTSNAASRASSRVVVPTSGMHTADSRPTGRAQ